MSVAITTTDAAASPPITGVTVALSGEEYWQAYLASQVSDNNID